MAKLKDFPTIPGDTRRSSEIRELWGVTPPDTLARTPYKFWDGTTIPGGINPLILTCVQHLDAIFKRHNYRLDGYAAGDDWCFSRRQTKHGKRWSLHSWAIALDINSTENPFSTRFVTTFTPQIITEVQALRHPASNRPVWQWGGTWGAGGGRFDTMHFQIGLGPAEAESMPGPKRRKKTDTQDVPPQVAPAAPRTNPAPDQTNVLNAIAAHITEIEQRVARHGEILEVLEAIVGGAPFYQLAEWMLATVLQRDPTDEEISDLARRFATGEKPEDAYWKMTK